MKVLAFMTSMSLLVACGSTSKKDADAQHQVVSKDEASAQAKTLPATTIIRVPVDAKGYELTDKAELRLSNEKNSAASQLASAFDSATAPKVIVDELDKTTSTQSFHGWRNSCRCRQSNCNRMNNQTNNYTYNQTTNNNYNNANSPNNYNYNNQDWISFNPTYYYYGYYYNWNYANSYTSGNYNYYQYNQGFNGSYSGYGQTPDFSYNQNTGYTPNQNPGYGNGQDPGYSQPIQY